MYVHIWLILTDVIRTKHLRYGWFNWVIVGKTEADGCAVCDSLRPDYTHFDHLNYLTSSRWKTALKPRPFTFTTQFNALSNITVYIPVHVPQSDKTGDEKNNWFWGKKLIFDVMLEADFKDCFLLLTTILQLPVGLLLMGHVDWCSAIQLTHILLLRNHNYSYT